MSRPDIIMVFVGESGSGKSTCINYFANYFTNASFSEESLYSKMNIVIPNRVCPNANYGPNRNRHTERNIHDTTVSQTQECTEYDFTWNGKCVKIVDTPGFNDTDASRNDENIQKILKKIGQLPFVTAILVTTNGTVARLLTSVKTTLDQLRGSLPDKIFENLFFILTNCTKETRNFPLDLIAAFKPREDQIFDEQNSLFSNQDLTVLENSRSVRRMVQTWEDSVETMERIMCKISKISSTSTQVFEDMRIRRERLVAHKENLIAKQKSLLNVMNELQTDMDRLKNATNIKNDNKNFTDKRTISVIEIEKKPYFSTICTEHGKVQVCHENCALSYKPELNLEHFKHCLAAEGNNCRHCKCGMNQHLHSYEIPVSKEKTVDDIIQSKKAAFDQATKDVQTIDGRIKQLQKTLDQCQNEVNQIKNDLMTTIRELKQICTHFNFPEEMKTTIEKLRQESKVAQDFKAKAEFDNTANAIENLLRQLQ